MYFTTFVFHSFCKTWLCDTNLEETKHLSQVDHHSSTTLGRGSGPDEKELSGQRTKAVGCDRIVREEVSGDASKNLGSFKRRSNLDEYEKTERQGTAYFTKWLSRLDRLLKRGEWQWKSSL